MTQHLEKGSRPSRTSFRADGPCSPDCSGATRSASLGGRATCILAPDGPEERGRKLDADRAEHPNRIHPLTTLGDGRRSCWPAKPDHRTGSTTAAHHRRRDPRGRAPRSSLGGPTSVRFVRPSCRRPRRPHKTRAAGQRESLDRRRQGELCKPRDPIDSSRPEQLSRGGLPAGVRRAAPPRVSSILEATHHTHHT